MSVLNAIKSISLYDKATGLSQYLLFNYSPPNCNKSYVTLAVLRQKKFVHRQYVGPRFAPGSSALRKRSSSIIVIGIITQTDEAIHWVINSYHSVMF